MFIRGRCWIGLALCLFEAGCSHSPRYYVDRGDRLYSEAKYTEAALSYRIGINKDANAADAHHGLGLAESRMGDFPTAYAEMLTATRLAPERDDFRVDLADLALVSYSSDPRHPRVLYDQVVSTAAFLLNKNPSSFDGMRFRGDVFAIDGKLEESEAFFKKANAIKPLQPSVILPMVQVLFRLNQTVEGETLAKDCIQIHKDAAPIYQLLFEHFVNTNRLTDAETLLKAQMANMPNDANPVLQLARFYFEHNQEPAMLNALQEILSKPRQFPRGHPVVGDFYASVHKWDQAIQEYTESLKSDSTSVEKQADRKRIAKVLIAEGKRDEAIEQLTQVLKFSPEDLDAHLSRAILRRESGDRGSCSLR